MTWAEAAGAKQKSREMQKILQLMQQYEVGHGLESMSIFPTPNIHSEWSHRIGDDRSIGPVWGNWLLVRCFHGWNMLTFGEIRKIQQVSLCFNAQGCDSHPIPMSRKLFWILYSSVVFCEPVQEVHGMDVFNRVHWNRCYWTSWSSMELCCPQFVGVLNSNINSIDLF